MIVEILKLRCFVGVFIVKAIKVTPVIFWSCGMHAPQSCSILLLLSVDKKSSWFSYISAALKAMCVV